MLKLSCEGKCFFVKNNISAEVERSKQSEKHFLKIWEIVICGLTGVIGELKKEL
jgi:hypothetical protein